MREGKEDGIEGRMDRRTILEGLRHPPWIGGQKRDLRGFPERNDYFENSCVMMTVVIILNIFQGKSCAVDM